VHAPGLRKRPFGRGVGTRMGRGSSGRSLCRRAAALAMCAGVLARSGGRWRWRPGAARRAMGTCSRVSGSMRPGTRWPARSWRAAVMLSSRITSAGGVVIGTVTRMTGQAPVVPAGALVIRPVAAVSFGAWLLMIRTCWSRPQMRVRMRWISPRLTRRGRGRSRRRPASHRVRAAQRWRRAGRGGFRRAAPGRRARTCCRRARRQSWRRRGFRAEGRTVALRVPVRSAICSCGTARGVTRAEVTRGRPGCALAVVVAARRCVVRSGRRAGRRCALPRR